MARCLATRSSRSQQSLCASPRLPWSCIVSVRHACMHADVTQGAADTCLGMNSLH